MANLNEKHLLSIARQVLEGTHDREWVAAQKERTILAYVGITFMLAGRYMVNDNNQVTKPLSDVLEDVILKGFKENSYYAGGSRRHSGHGLRDAARYLGLYKKSAPGDPYRITLDPSPALQALINEHRNGPAIRAFLKDMKEGFAREEKWRLEFSQQSRRGDVELDAQRVVAEFEEVHGVAGLRVLHTELGKRV